MLAPRRAGRPHGPQNAGAGQLIGTSVAAQHAPAGYGLRGAGVQVGVWDDGHARVSHVDLRGRVRARDLGGPSAHATHTTATLAGSGAGDAAARGVAVAARVWAYDWLLDTIEVESVAPGLSVSSHAYAQTLGWSRASACPDRAMWWGGSAPQDAAFGRYGGEAASADALVQRTDLLLVWPAGNERLDTGASPAAAHYHAGSCTDLYHDAHVQELTLQFGTIGGASLAKNVLTVGAARAVDPDALRADRIVVMDMSGFGPSDDGRIKPDLLAGGDAVRSASVEADDAYAVLEGTSSATAAAAGAVALLTELYRDTHDGADPRASELKALLVHTARDAGARAGPDYGTGYGLLDATAAAALIDADGASGAGERRLWFSVVSDTGFALATAGPVPVDTALRVTLVWTDPPAAPIAMAEASPVLVNDLDLMVVAEDGGAGEVFHPWALDPDEPTAAATRVGANRRDNVEVVDVAADDAGGRAFRIEVQAARALWRGRAQGFALVSSVPLVAAGASADTPIAALPRYVVIETAAGERPEPARVSLGNRGGGELGFRTRSLAPWLAVSPEQGTAPAELAIEIDPALLDAESGEALAAVEIDSDDATGPQRLGIIWRVACEPDCDGRECGSDPRCGASCGGCRDGESCADGRCAVFAADCPRADLGSELGSTLASGDARDGTGSQSGSCGGAAASDSSFIWTAPAGGRFAFTTRGSDHDTVLYVQNGACSGPELGCSDDSGAVTSALALELEAGAQVTAVVDAFDGDRDGAFRLNVERAPCPSAELGSRVGFALARATSAGGIDDLAGSCGGEGSEDVALAWTAPAAGRYRFALFDPRFQAVLYLRESSCEGAELGCSAAADVGPVEVELAAGDTVVVVVDGREGQSGEFTLDVLALDRDCAAAGACGAAGPAGSCACDAACVAASDCCADACERCGHCRCQPGCAGRACGDDGCGGSCGDCAAGDVCSDGRCAADPCAGMRCDACSTCSGGRCVPLPEGAACEDGDLCTVLDACRQGVCAGRDRGCDDGFECTHDQCDGRSGACVFEPDRACCELETCDDGGCAAVDPRCVDGGDAGALRDAGIEEEPGEAGDGCGCRAIGGSRSTPPCASFALAVVAVITWRRRWRARSARARDPRVPG